MLMHNKQISCNTAKRMYARYTEMACQDDTASRAGVNSTNLDWPTGKVLASKVNERRYYFGFAHAF